MKLPEEWEFLLATRFWAGVILSVSITLADPGFPTQPWYVTLSKLLGLIAGQFIVVKTVDRNIGDAAKVTTVTMPENVSGVTATKE